MLLWKAIATNVMLASCLIAPASALADTGATWVEVRSDQADDFRIRGQDSDSLIYVDLGSFKNRIGHVVEADYYRVSFPSSRAGKRYKVLFECDSGSFTTQSVEAVSPSGELSPDERGQYFYTRRGKMPLASASRGELLTLLPMADYGCGTGRGKAAFETAPRVTNAQPFVAARWRLLKAEYPVVLANIAHILNDSPGQYALAIAGQRADITGSQVAGCKITFQLASGAKKSLTINDGLEISAYTEAPNAQGEQTPYVDLKNTVPATRIYPKYADAGEGMRKANGLRDALQSLVYLCPEGFNPDRYLK